MILAALLITVAFGAGFAVGLAVTARMMPKVVARMDGAEIAGFTARVRAAQTRHQH